MDLLRAWLFAAAGFVIVNLALSFTVASAVPLLYLLPTFVAGIIAAAYHEQFGRGGRSRHLLAVLGAPVIIGVYWVVVRFVQTGFFHPLTACGVIGSAAVSAAIGMAVVIAVRRLLTERPSEPSPQGPPR